MRVLFYLDHTLVFASSERGARRRASQTVSPASPRARFHSQSREVELDPQPDVHLPGTRVGHTATVTEDTCSPQTPPNRRNYGYGRVGDGVGRGASLRGQRLVHHGAERPTHKLFGAVGGGECAPCISRQTDLSTGV